MQHIYLRMISSSISCLSADKQEIEEEIIRRYMCCMGNSGYIDEKNVSVKAGGMQQTNINETLSKNRQVLRTGD